SALTVASEQNPTQATTQARHHIDPNTERAGLRCPKREHDDVQTRFRAVHGWVAHRPGWLIVPTPPGPPLVRGGEIKISALFARGGTYSSLPPLPRGGRGGSGALRMGNTSVPRSASDVESSAPVSRLVGLRRSGVILPCESAVIPDSRRGINAT